MDSADYIYIFAHMYMCVALTIKVKEEGACGELEGESGESKVREGRYLIIF